MSTRWILCGIIGILTCALGLMACIKVYTLHTAYFDLGVFEHAIWDIAFNGQWRWLFYGHIHYLLPLDALLYKLIPASYTLVLKQAFVLGLSGWFIQSLSTKQNKYLPTIAYSLFFPVWYLALFDFHPEHMVVPLGLGFYWATQRNKMGLAVLCAILIALVKEPFAIAGAFYGIYLIVRFKKHGWGAACVVLCGAIFYVDKFILLPAFTHGIESIIYRPAFSWMGSSLSDIVIYIATHPLQILEEIFSNPKKLLYLASTLAAFAFLPLLSPLELIPALPILAISLLSRNENYYGLSHHYTAGLIAPYCAAFCLALPRIQRFWTNRQLSQKLLMTGIILSILLVHVGFSPSPISRLFWTDKVWGYGISTYSPNNRDAMIKKAIEIHVPRNRNVSVAVSNTLFTSSLAKRNIFEVFPRGVTGKAAVPAMAAGGSPFSGQVQYIVLDLFRPWYIEGNGCRWQSKKYEPFYPDNQWLGCAPPLFQQNYLSHVEKAREQYDIVFEEDGFIIGKLKFTDNPLKKQ